MKLVSDRFSAATNAFLGIIQHIISSPLWAIGIMAGTLMWMAFETWVAKKPVEGPFNGWAFTVLIYTILSLWVENFMKVQQAHQSKLQQEQMDRVEFILRVLGDQSAVTQEMLSRNEERDKILHHLIKVTNQLAEGLYDVLAARKDSL